MIPMDEAIGEAMFKRLLTASLHLGLTDLLILKSALGGKIAYRELPDKLRLAFARLARPEAGG